MPISGPEVRELTIHGEEHAVNGATFSLPTVEHCQDEFGGSLFVDGVSGAPSADAAGLIGGPRREVTDLATLEENETVVLPPEHRASYVVRQLLGTMMKPVQADT